MHNKWHPLLLLSDVSGGGTGGEKGATTGRMGI